MKTLKRTWADISLDNLEYNYRSIRAHLPSGTRFLGVMKADAYGHGAVPVSRALADLGAEYLAVSNLEEAVQIRRGEVRLPILILGYTPPEYAANMIFLDITQEVHSLTYAQELNEALAGTNYILNVHLKLDTGMTRIGFFAYDNDRTLDELKQAAALPHPIGFIQINYKYKYSPRKRAVFVFIRKISRRWNRYCAPRVYR